MNPRMRAVGGVGAIVLGLAGPAWAGWVIEQVMRGDVEAGHVHLMVQANRMKTLMVGTDGRPVAATIVDFDAETITQVDYAGRRAAMGTVQEYVDLLRGATQMASQAMGHAMQQMQEALKDMPPEQRQMMEQMMRSQMGAMGGASQECREPHVEVRKTGQRATIAGYPAERFDVVSDGRPSAELWVSPAIPAWRELDPRKLERFSRQMARAVPGCGGGRAGMAGADHAWRLAGEGYPVRAVHRQGGTTTIEVVRAQSRAIPPAEFQPPAGFARTALRDLLSGQ